MKTVSSKARTLSLMGAVVLAAGAACTTEDVDTHRTFLVTRLGTPENTAPLAISLVADFTSYEQEQLNAAAGSPGSSRRLRMDGRWVVVDDQPILISEGTVAFWSPPGLHTFELVDDGGATVLATDPYDVVPGHANRLLAFGDGQALQHHYLSNDLAVPDGTQTYAVVNFVRDQTIEVITCSDLTAVVPQACTAVSGSLAFGGLATGQVALPNTEPLSSLGAAARGIYYRLTPTEAVPTPLPNRIGLDLAAVLAGVRGGTGSAPVFVGGPIFLDPQTGGPNETL